MNNISQIINVNGNLSPDYTIQHEVSNLLSLEGKITPLQTLNINISIVDGEIIGSLSNTFLLSGELSNQSGILTGQLSMAGRSGGNADYYTGEYIVTPLADTEIILNTKDKILYDNVTVQEIPFRTTSNQSGGYTVIIS